MRLLSAAIVFVFAPTCVLAQTTVIRNNPCPRFGAGNTVRNPPNLFSRNGTLTVNLSYNTGMDSEGRTLFCFATQDGKESPTLHVHPGDHLIVHVKNNLPAPASSSDWRTWAIVEPF